MNILEARELTKDLVGDLVVAFRDRTGTDTFNDSICFCRNGAIDKLYYCTTDPGKAPRTGSGKVSTHRDGVGRIRAGLWKEAYSFGYHHGKKSHPCLKHDGPLGIERFSEKDLEWLDYGIYHSSFNIHRAGFSSDSSRVGDYSHGCIVFKSRFDHWEFLLSVGYPEHGLQHEVQVPNGGRISLLIIDVTKSMR